MLRSRLDRKGLSMARASIPSLGILLVVAVLLPACTRHVGAVSPAYAERVRQFGFRLFAEMAQDSVPENMVLSPVGVEMCLAMAMNGAGGMTRTEMAQALGIHEAELDSLNRANAELLVALSSSDHRVRLSVANSVWGRKDLAFSRTFQEKCSRSYGANVRSVDFTSQSAVRDVNRWASEKTGGLFPELVSSTDPSDVLRAFSVMYFAGKWAVPFDQKYTSPGDFHLQDGRTVKRQMMYTGGDFACLDTDGFSAVLLPFADRRFGMYVFVPAESSDLPRFLSSINDTTWRKWTSAFRVRPGLSIGLPRFIINARDELKTSLLRMHMTSAFDSASSDFSAMIDGRNTFPILLSGVTHCVIVDVEESGTVAAAATSTELIMGSLPRIVVADHPFFFALTDTQTNVIIFMGAVYDPPQ